jgi:hypothetical protein
MKIFRIKYQDETDVILAKCEQEAKDFFIESNDICPSKIESITEIPEKEWDNTFVLYEEEGIKSFRVSLREEAFAEKEPRIISTTNR